MDRGEARARAGLASVGSRTAGRRVWGQGYALCRPRHSPTEPWLASILHGLSLASLDVDQIRISAFMECFCFGKELWRGKGKGRLIRPCKVPVRSLRR